MSKVLQQGAADGLCGLYCVLNFLSSVAGWKSESPKKNMEYILEAVQAEGLLSPSWITQGFRSAELKGVLNRIFDRWWMPYEAYFLCEIARPKAETTFAAYNRILANDGAIIGRWERPSHWLLFMTVGDQRRVIDSNNASPDRPFDGRSTPLCSEDSIILLPKERQTIQIGS